MTCNYKCGPGVACYGGASLFFLGKCVFLQCDKYPVKGLTRWIIPVKKQLLIMAFLHCLPPGLIEFMLPVTMNHLILFENLWLICTLYLDPHQGTAYINSYFFQISTWWRRPDTALWPRLSSPLSSPSPPPVSTWGSLGWKGAARCRWHETIGGAWGLVFLLHGFFLMIIVASRSPTSGKQYK